MFQLIIITLVCVKLDYIIKTCIFTFATNSLHFFIQITMKGIVGSFLSTDTSEYISTKICKHTYDNMHYISHAAPNQLSERFINYNNTL